MATILTLVHVLTCVVIVLFVLLQSGRGGDAGALFGSANASSVFGGAGPAPFLTKVTAVAGAVFFLTSIGLTLTDSSNRGSVVERLAPPDAPAPAPAAVDASAATDVSAAPDGLTDAAPAQ